MSVEIDWIGAWYGIYGVWDSTINFWLSATFAVIVAIHALGVRATPSITRLVAFLYLAFSMYTVLRALSIAQETVYIQEKIRALGLEEEQLFFAPLGPYSDYVMYGIFLLGSIATFIFILTAPGRKE